MCIRDSLLNNEQRKIKLSESVLKFKQDLVSEFVEQFDKIKQIDPSLLEITFKNLHNKKIFNLVSDEDLFAWKFAKKGFFKFKENIPKINQRIFENYSKIIFKLG